MSVFFNAVQNRLHGADTAPVIKVEKKQDSWSKTGRCQLCCLTLQSILQQMAKLSDQDPEYMLQSAHLHFSFPLHVTTSWPLFKT